MIRTGGSDPTGPRRRPRSWPRSSDSLRSTGSSTGTWSSPTSSPPRGRLPADSGRDHTINDVTGWYGGFDAVLGNPPWEHSQAAGAGVLRRPRSRDRGSRRRASARNSSRRCPRTILLSAPELRAAQASDRGLRRTSPQTRAGSRCAAVATSRPYAGLRRARATPSWAGRVAWDSSSPRASRRMRRRSTSSATWWSGDRWSACSTSRTPSRSSTACTAASSSAC